ncbi:hypothetical protein [Paenibacillus oralis]|uniref:hypothetical protein n=1 Tax=Paenibacillus oralis TaxID=2490856 RepID=UPI0015B2ED35|nr:hypothetical protein [Paenibacillus oralis]
MAEKAKIIPIDTSRLQLDSLVSMEDQIDGCVYDYKKITDVYKAKRSKKPLM